METTEGVVTAFYALIAVRVLVDGENRHTRRPRAHKWQIVPDFWSTVTHGGAEAGKTTKYVDSQSRTERCR